MQVMICGDTHANLTFATQVTHLAGEHDCDMIIQVGDFGYWPRTPAGKRYLDTLSHIAGDAGIEWAWIDGNHEDHEELQRIYTGAHPHEIAPHIRWLPRGTTLELGGHRFLFFGGAPSVDTYYRTPGYDWFPEEVCTTAEFERAAGTKDVDVVVAHDVPTGTLLTLDEGMWPEDRERASMHHRDLMLELVQAVRPSLWLAGHYHQRTLSRVNGTVVHVFDRDDAPMHRAVGILDVETLTVSELPRNVVRLQR